MDGNAQGAESQAMSRGALHGVVWQTRHTANRKGRTCRRLASTLKKTIDTREPLLGVDVRPYSQFRTDILQQSEEFRLQRCEGRLRHRASRMNHDIPS